jgi:chaperonin GroES
MSTKPLFRPLGNRVYVRRNAVPQMTAGGLHIPDTALRPATDRGTVVAVGPGGVGAHGKHVAVSVDVGDEVLFNRQAIELDVPMDDGNNEKLVIVQEHELLGYRTVKPTAKRGRPPKTEGEAAIVVPSVMQADGSLTQTAPAYATGRRQPTTVVNITAHGASPEAIADVVTQKAAELTGQRLNQKESV